MQQHCAFKSHLCEVRISQRGAGVKHWAPMEIASLKRVLAGPSDYDDDTSKELFKYSKARNLLVLGKGVCTGAGIFGY
jgi:hypothetical protein